MCGWLGLSSKLRIAFNLQLNTSNTGNWSLTFCLRDRWAPSFVFLLNCVRCAWNFKVILWKSGSKSNHKWCFVSQQKRNINVDFDAVFVVGIRSSSHHWEKANKVFENCFKRKALNNQLDCICSKRFVLLSTGSSESHSEWVAFTRKAIPLDEHFSQAEWNADWVKYFHEEKTHSISTQTRNE